MQTVTTKAIAKVAAVATGLAMATSMLSLAPIAHAAALSDSQVSAIISLLSSFGADSSTIANVQASLTGSAPAATVTTTSVTFTKDLTVGSKGADVTALQQALVAKGYLSASATGYFGSLTKAAVIKWQSAAGITPASGYFGPKSRAAFGAVSGSTSTTGGTTTTTNTTTGTVVTGNGLKVMLASDSPNNVALVQGQAIGGLAKFTFSNPTSADIKITNIAFKRIGVSNDATLANVYLYSGAKRLTDSAGVSNSAFNFNDSTGLFTVPAGSTYSVSVLADIAGSTSGQQIGAQLVSVASTGTLDSSVSFPINGYTQTVSAATLATVDFNTTTLPSSTSVNPQNDYVVWQNTVTVGTRAVKMSSFQLRNIGSIKTSDINNLRLYIDGVQTGSAATLATDNTVTWDLSASPLRLETGGRVIKVTGDIVGGSNNTFQFSLRRASDAQMIDTDLDQPVLATANGSTFSARSATSATIAAGTVSVVKANNSPSSNVSLGATNVKFASFEMRAAGEDVKVDNLDVRATASTGTRGLDNGKVFLNGVQVGSTKDLTDATDINYTFGSSFILKAGTTAIVDIYADAKTSTGAAYTSGDTVSVRLSALSSSNGQGQVSLTSINVPTSAVTANTLTITSASATLTQYSGYGATTMIAGTNNAKLGAFTLSTGATEGMNVNTITVTLSSNESATITDLKLVDNATGAQIGSTKTSPSTSNSFSVNFNMASNATKVIDIIANVKAGSNIGTWTAAADGSGTGASTGSAISFGDSTVSLQTITIGSSVLTTAVGVSPDNQNVIAGTSMVKVGSFDFTAQYSPYTIDQINVKVPANAATAVSSITLKYPDASGATQSSTQNVTVSSGSQSHATSTFTGLTFYIPAGTTKKVDAYVNLSSIQNDGDSGKSVTVTLDANEGFHATNSAGTATTTLSSGDLASSATSGKGTLIVRKSIPTLSAVALDSSALTQGANIVLARVKVTADAAGDISWAKMAFTVNKTTTVVFGATTTFALWSGSSQISGSFATTTATSSTSLTQTVDAWGVSSTGGTLTFLPVSEQSVSAGSSATYELRATISLPSTAGGYSVNTSIANAQTSASSTGTAAQVGNTVISGPSFTWSDKSSVASVHSTTTSDWTDDYLIKTLPLVVGNLSVSQ